MIGDHYIGLATRWKIIKAKKNISYLCSKSSGTKPKLNLTYRILYRLLYKLYLLIRILYIYIYIYIYSMA